MSTIFAKLDVNPFADDVVTEPRRISFSVKGLNEKPLEQLIANFRKLTEGELPRRQIAAEKAQLVVSPNRGYGKSHLLGRLFKKLGEEATLIYLRPFQDPQRIWSSILQATVQELERPDQNGKEAGSQLEAFSKGVLAHVSADHIADVKNDSRIRDAVKYLRAHPLKVLGRAPGSKPLVERIKSRLDDPNFLQKLARLLRTRGIDLVGRETAWLKVLTGYAFDAANGLEQDAALKWLRGEPLEAEELDVLKLTNADNEGKPDSSAQEINDLCFRRLESLCALSSYYRPFVFCFDQTEFYGSDRALVNALGKGVEALHATVPNQLTIVTTNATNWTEDILPVMDPAYRDRFSREEITLEGITANQAKDLIKHRLADFRVEETAVRKFIEEDSWLDAQFSGLRQIGVRDLLMAAAERSRALAKPASEPPQRTPLADLFAIEANKIRANEALHRYNQDCLMWFAQALAEGYDRVAIHKTRERYFAVQWAWPDLSIYFAFESGDHNARWRAIAREAITLAGSSKRFGALVFRTPDLKTIPQPTWGVAKTQISEAQKKGLRIVSLTLDEVCELHAARELYSNALQGNIDYDATDVLKWLKARFEPWLDRCRESAIQKGHSERPLHIVQNQNNGAQPTIRPEMELTEAQLKTVLSCVSQKMLVDINEILRTLGDESLKTAVLRAVESSRNIKAHSGPQTIYLQWRVVA